MKSLHIKILCVVLLGKMMIRMIWVLKRRRRHWDGTRKRKGLNDFQRETSD